MSGRRLGWRLWTGAVLFVLFAPGALWALPLAGLLLMARPDTRRERLWAGALGGAGLALLVLQGGGLFDSAVAAFALLAAVAFVAGAVYAPDAALRQALRAVAGAALGTAALAFALLGRNAIAMIAWDATRELGFELRRVVSQVPQFSSFYDAIVGPAAATLPGVVCLQALAGLTLAWQWHTRLAARPLGPPLGRFRDFRIGDRWVWALVGAIAAWVVPGVAAVKTAALNVGLVAAVLYVVRGAAIVVAAAAAFGVSTAALLVALGLAAVLVMPLAVVLPGLSALGICDTWLEFRRRLAGRPHLS